MNVFTYGSLMYPAVWARVTGLSAPGVRARVDGFAARGIRGQSYPALVREPGAVTEGVLYVAVPEWAVRRLDDFEGSFYVRGTVRLRGEGGEQGLAEVYLAADEQGPEILAEYWEAGAFEAAGLQDFLEKDPGFTESGRG